VARRVETDRWLFGVTLVLCLMGAVMIFSASAITAQQMYGHSYIFVARQAAALVIGLLGMFALMKLDYHRLREPAVVYTVLCVVLVMLVGTFFLDKSHATHRWIKLGPLNLQPSERNKPGIQQAGFSADNSSGGSTNFCVRGADHRAAGPGHVGGCGVDHGSDFVCRGT
jgi:cell division protein FtsW